MNWGFEVLEKEKKKRERGSEGRKAMRWREEGGRRKGKEKRERRKRRKGKRKGR